MKALGKAIFEFINGISFKNNLQILLLCMTVFLSGDLIAQRGGNGKVGNNRASVQRHERGHSSTAGLSDRRDGRNDRRDDRADYRDDRRGDRYDRRDDRRDDRWDRHRRHYRRHYRYGHRLHVLPIGYRTILWRGTHFYFHAGLWYNLGPTGYVVISAPVGAHLTVLPDDYLTITLTTGTYYYYYGTYYRYDSMTKVYLVVDAPVGAEVPAIPEGYTTEKYNGIDVYVVGAVRYRPVIRGGMRFFIVL